MITIESPQKTIKHKYQRDNTNAWEEAIVNTEINLYYSMQTANPPIGQPLRVHRASFNLILDSVKSQPLLEG